MINGKILFLWFASMLNIAMARADLQCTASEELLDELILTAQVVDYDPMLNPVPGSLIGSRQHACVILSVEIEKSGKVIDAQVIHSIPPRILDREAIRAARQLKFKIVDGIRRPSRFVVYYYTSLGSEK